MTGETFTLLVCCVAIAAVIVVIGCVHLSLQGWRPNAFVRFRWWPWALGVALYWEHRSRAGRHGPPPNLGLAEEYGIRLFLDLAIFNITFNLYLERHA